MIALWSRTWHNTDETNRLLRTIVAMTRDHKREDLTDYHPILAPVHEFSNN